MAKNFRINKQQAWYLSNAAAWTEECEVVINSESYDSDERSFEIAVKPKDTIPDSLWQRIEPHLRDNGWAFFLMLEDGSTELLEEEE